jgi:hypothetical protein
MEKTIEEYDVFFYDMCQRGCKRSNHNIGLIIQALNNGTRLNLTKVSRLESMGNDHGAYDLLPSCQNYDVYILTFGAKEFNDVKSWATECLNEYNIPLRKIIVLGPDSFPEFTAFKVASGNVYLNKGEASNLVDKIREVSNL